MPWIEGSSIRGIDDRVRFLLRAAGIALILLASVRIVLTYRVFNHTWDETASVACGMEWLDQGVYDFDPKHPPLGRVASAIGLYLQGVKSAGALDMWAEGNELLHEGGRYWSNLTLARVGLLPFFVAACIVTWIWTSWVWGRAAGLLAMGLFSLIPPVLGHAGIAMTNIALTATLPAALFIFALWLENPSRKRSQALGVSVGLAILSEFSALVFLPVCGLLMLWAYRNNVKRADIRVQIIRRLRALGTAFLLAAVVLVAGYRFTLSPPRLQSLRPAFDRVLGATGTVHDIAYRALETPLPGGALLRGLDQLWAYNHEGLPNYFLGERRNRGWWYYFPIILAVKTPVAFLLLVISGILFIYRDRSRDKRPRARAVVAASVGILAVGMLAHINTGIRHILPIYLALAAIAGYGALRMFQASRAWAAVAALLIAWCGVSSALAHPDYLAYFNELADGSSGKFGVDSDLDYGQDLARLQKACERHHVDSLALIYNGSANPNRFGLPPLRRLEPGQLQSGWVAISMNTLKLGLPDQPAGYSWLERYRPIETVGKSIRLYFIPPADAEPSDRPLEARRDSS